jgi:hypothetical protein
MMNQFLPDLTDYTYIMDQIEVYKQGVWETSNKRIDPILDYILSKILGQNFI